MIKKSAKKKAEKKEKLELHQHKSLKGSVIHTHGFIHDLSLKHDKVDTQKAHDLTIRLDSQLKGASSNG